MANRLKVAKVFSIQELHRQGWSRRRITRGSWASAAAPVGLASRRCVKRGRSRPPARTNQTGPKRPPAQAIRRQPQTGPKRPTGSRSLCEPFREIIVSKLEAGLSAQRIFQDLDAEHGFEGKYSSVRRYVARLNERRELPFRRLESLPGEEAQIDFGAGRP